MRLLFFQHGDFGEAHQRFEEGAPETYRDQKASVDFVSTLRSDAHVTVVAVCTRSHEERLAEGLYSIGISGEAAHNRTFVRELLTRAAPDRIVCRTPNRLVIEWAARHGVPVLPSFADMFTNAHPRAMLRNFRLRRWLVTPVVPCVANHSLNASRSVAGVLRYPVTGIVPWDWSRLEVEQETRSGLRNPAAPVAFFGGTMSAAKGVGDCLEAVRLLRDRGLRLTFNFAGPGDLGAWRAQAEALGVADQVVFLGQISHAEVLRHMQQSDAVVVPSRHDYPEGLPNMIYETLASRTPLIVSNHPAFAGRLKDRRDCLIFRASDPGALAGTLAELLSDPALFAHLSERSATAHDRLYIGMEWTRLVGLFLADPLNHSGWVAENSLARLERETA